MTEHVLGMILKGYPRISETFISNEIRLMEERGHRIRIFSMRQPREAFTHESVKKIRAKVDYLPEGLLSGLPVFLKAAGSLWRQDPAALRRGAALAARRYAATRKAATLKHLLQASVIRTRFLPESGVGHLHAHFAHSPASVAHFSSVLSGLPFSFFAHAKDIYTQDRGSLREKIAAARLVVTCTEYNRIVLSDIAEGLSTPVRRVYHGIDTHLFSGRGERPPAAPYQLLTVSRLSPKKGLPTVYRALKILADGGVDFTHRLIGSGEERENIEALIRDLGLSERCLILGTLPHEKVLGYYRAADLFVLGCEIAANGDRDGIPNVFFEALAMGLPSVGTRVSALPELLRDGETGLLVPPRDPAALAGAMRRLLSDSSLRSRVIENGQKLVRERFDNQRLAGDLEAVYREAGLFGAKGA